MSSLTYVKSRCLCKGNEFIVPLNATSLPQATDLCHCSSCRHITGQLAVYCVRLAGPPLSPVEGTKNPQTPADLSKLSSHNATPAGTRYFCSTCGAYIVIEVNQPGVERWWSVAVGSLERAEDIATIGYHQFIKDTRDGGLSNHIPVYAGTEVPRYAHDDPKERLPAGWKDSNLDALQQKHRHEIHAHCHCRKISLRLCRPKQEQSVDKSTGPLPRFDAHHCFCAACRLSSGSVCSSWIAIPCTSIFDDHSSSQDGPINLASSSPNRLKNLTQYNSSPDTYREFCTTCGATVFWWTKKNFLGDLAGDPNSADPAVVALASGLMDEGQGGVLSEDWIAWSGTAFSGEALDKNFAVAVEQGFKGAG